MLHEPSGPLREGFPEEATSKLRRGADQRWEVDGKEGGTKSGGKVEKARDRQRHGDPKDHATFPESRWPLHVSLLGVGSRAKEREEAV